MWICVDVSDIFFHHKLSPLIRYESFCVGCLIRKYVQCECDLALYLSLGIALVILLLSILFCEFVIYGCVSIGFVVSVCCVLSSCMSLVVVLCMMLL